MREGGRAGAIVTSASLNAHVPLWGASSTRQQGRAENFNQGRARLDAAPFLIRVNAVAAGLVETH